LNTYSSFGDRLLGDDGQKHANDHHKVASKCCAGKQQGGVFENLHGVVLHVDSGAKEGLQKYQKHCAANILLWGATFALNSYSLDQLEDHDSRRAGHLVGLVFCGFKVNCNTQSFFFVNIKTPQNVNNLYTKDIYHR
jgi:hypothetical protein